MTRPHGATANEEVDASRLALQTDGQAQRTAVATRPYPLIDVSGAPYERGRQHGRAAGDLIRRYPDALRQVIMVEARYRDPDMEPREISDAELEERALRFLPFFERFAPEQLVEIQGVADGAEVPFWMALLVNVRAEVGFFDSVSYLSTGCTAFAAGPSATADGGVLIGQNQDQNALMRDLTVVLRVEPDQGPRMLTATFGGLIAYGGINSEGVGIMQNSLANSVWRFGLPHYPLKRALLEQDSIAGCLAQFDRAPLGSCANYVLCDREAVVDVEATPDGYAVQRGADGWVGHANNFRDPGLAADEKLLAAMPDSARRTTRIDTLMAADSGSITLDDAKRWLSDHDGFPTSICRHATSAEPTAMHSMYSVICEADKGRLHITHGNPCENPYSTYSLS
jgi:isopenicillin-N N-acyltransferase-like protein